MRADARAQRWPEAGPHSVPQPLQTCPPPTSPGCSAAPPPVEGSISRRQRGHGVRGQPVGVGGSPGSSGPTHWSEGSPDLGVTLQPQGGSLWFPAPPPAQSQEVTTVQWDTCLLGAWVPGSVPGAHHVLRGADGQPPAEAAPSQVLVPGLWPEASLSPGSLPASLPAGLSIHGPERPGAESCHPRRPWRRRWALRTRPSVQPCPSVGWALSLTESFTP